MCICMCVCLYIYVYIHNLLLFFSNYIKYILISIYSTTKYYTKLQNEKGNPTNYRICFRVIYNLIVEHMEWLDGYMDLVDMSMAR
jgi:hypothetical protein